jgi:acyl carrier protein
MKETSEQALVDQVIGWVKENRLANGANDLEISSDTNLLESGLLDSFAFVDLILFLENCTGEKLDLMEVNPEEFAVVRGLCRLALRTTQEAQANPAGHKSQPAEKLAAAAGLESAETFRPDSFSKSLADRACVSFSGPSAA